MTAYTYVGIIPRMKNDTFERFVARFEQLMEEQGGNPRAISLSANLNSTFVRDMLEKRKSPSIENAAALAHALGSTLSEMIRKEGEMPAQDAIDKMTPEERREVMRYLWRMAREEKNGKESPA